MDKIRWVIFAAMAVLALPAARAQFGPPPSQGSGPKLPAPTAFPPSGTFPTTESVTLFETDPGATIHFTMDGSMPTAKSPAYDPTQLIFLTGIYEGDHGFKAGYTIRAVAIEDGDTNSDVSDFEYLIDRRDRTAYVSEEVLPGVRMVRDSDNDKMFLIKGTTKCLLIDSGLGRGDLKTYLSQFTGGLPIEVIFTHNHGDHIGQADQFIRDSVEHIGEPDRPGLERLLKMRNIPDDVIAKNVVSAHDGDRVDIGGRSVVIYAAPGHTPGSIVIYDEQTGNLFTGDAFGSNSATIPDALWMQGTQTSLDIYWAVIKSARAKFGPNVKYIMTGHNDRPLAGETYLDNLESALRSLMDKGDATLIPSYRPVGLRQVVVGDRLQDPNWIAINVNHDKYLPAPVDQISGLVGITVTGATLAPEFKTDVKDYSISLPAGAKSIDVTPDPTSSRSTITVNGQAADAGKPHSLKLPISKVEIDVKSPDGTQTTTFSVTVNRK
jgi:glyoxylase-like metal-dependent hydrolase (beta-lactamase superfamily II)